jgi:hypothetical protein
VLVETLLHATSHGVTTSNSRTSFILSTPRICFITGNRWQSVWINVSLLSCPWPRQLYRTKSLHQPRYPVTASAQRHPETVTISARSVVTKSHVM